MKTIKGKCRACGKSCDDFFIHNGRMLCDSCFIKLANKHLRYKLKMRQINGLLVKCAYLLVIAFAFVCGVALGVLW